MTDQLPAPLVPAEVDLRGTPLPVDAFVELAMQTFGVDRETARRAVFDMAVGIGALAEDDGRA